MAERLSSEKIIREPAREVNVFKEADVVVVGGGPAGIAAAVAAARNGAKTVLSKGTGTWAGWPPAVW